MNVSVRAAAGGSRPPGRRAECASCGGRPFFSSQGQPYATVLTLLRSWVKEDDAAR